MCRCWTSEQSPGPKDCHHSSTVQVRVVVYHCPAGRRSAMPGPEVQIPPQELSLPLRTQRKSLFVIHGFLAESHPQGNPFPQGQLD